MKIEQHQHWAKTCVFKTSDNRKRFETLFTFAFESQHCASFDFVSNLPKASISLNHLRILVEQEWPDSVAPGLGNNGMNLLSFKEIETGQLVYRFVLVF